MNRWLLCLAATVLLGCPAAEPDPVPEDSDAEDPDPVFDPDLAAALDAALAQSVATYGPPGATAAVVIGDWPVWTGATGLADIASDEAMTSSHHLKAGSVTKSFVAATVVQLHLEGSLSLDDSVEAHHPGVERGDEMTLRHLLMHTSGLREYGLSAEFQQDAAEVWHADDLIALIDGQPLLFDPGTSWSYANTNFVIAGLIIEAKPGRTWQEEVTDRFLGPADLTETTAPRSGDGWGDIASGYVGTLDRTLRPDPSAVGASGNMVSTSADLARWARALWTPDPAVISEGGRAEMVSDPFLVTEQVSYGLATMIIQPEPGDPVEYAHNGALDGFVAWSGTRPDLDAGLGLMANGWPDDGNGGYDAGYASHLAQDLWAVVEEGLAP